MSKSQENSEKFEFLWKKTWKLKENEKCVTRSPTEVHSIEFSSLKLLSEKFANVLEISGKTQGM